MSADIFDSNNLSPREQVVDWANIKKQIGDKVSGVFKGYWIVAPRGQFKGQIGIALETTEGKIVGINVNDNEYFRAKLSVTQIGDEVGLKYEGDKDVNQIQPAKIIKFYNKTQKEREEKGIASVGVMPSETISATEGSEDESEDSPF